MLHSGTASSGKPKIQSSLTSFKALFLSLSSSGYSLRPFPYWLRCRNNIQSKVSSPMQTVLSEQELRRQFRFNGSRQCSNCVKQIAGKKKLPSDFSISAKDGLTLSASDLANVLYSHFLFINADLFSLHLCSSGGLPTCFQATASNHISSGLLQTA